MKRRTKTSKTKITSEVKEENWIPLIDGIRIYVENSKGINATMKINVKRNTSNILFCMLALNIENFKFKIVCKST